MYSASAQFHSAVYGNSPVERVLFKFADGTIFTNEDIHIGSGLKLIEAVNLEEELTIGGCPASSLEATIMNYHGLLSGFVFGEAEVSLGVRTETVTGNPVSANAVAYVGGRRFCGYSTEPYLKLDGEAPAVQPGFPVHAIIADGLAVYCIGLEGQCWKATLAGGQTWASLEPDTWADLEATTWDSLQGTLTAVGDVTLSAFMTAKAAGWAAQGRGLWSNGGVVYEYYTNGNADRFEYVKLGTFLLNTPAKRKVNMIAVSALDRMSLFDVVADDFWNDLAYPITIGEIFTQLCTFVGVPKATITFINSTRSFAEAPLAAEGITAREILGWIAEAACSFARMTRDGEVELAWFGVRPVSIPMTQYFSIAPAEYEVAQVDKLQISGSETDIGVVIGEGTNGYQILDNPLLYGATDTEVRTLGVPIYNRLIAYAPFSPIVAAAVCDWSIQAGDIIEIALNGVPYALPVYTQTITWKGNARVTYESTGAEKRPVMTATNRRLYSQRRAIHEITVDVNGLESRLIGAEGDIAGLELTVDGFELEFVSKDGVIASINASSEEIKLAAGKISLEGIITANNYFKILADGSIEANAGTIGGFEIDGDALTSQYLIINPTNAVIQVGSWYFSSNGLEYGSTYTPYFDFEYTNGTSLIAGSAPMQVGPYTNGIVNTLSLIGTTITLSATVSAYQCVFDDNAGGYNQITFRPTASNVGNIGSSTYYWNQVVANNFVDISARRFKKNIEPLQDVDYGSIDDFRPVLYEDIDDNDGTKRLGLIAEELEAICPYVVAYDKATQEIFGIDYSRLTPLLIYEIQKLRKRVAILEGGVEI